MPDEEWEYLMKGDAIVKRRPWCDCEKKIGGFTKRADGCWVRPCCLRRERAMWEKWGNEPIPPDHLRSQCERTTDTADNKVGG